ncbi:glycosyltransferase [Clostridium sp.]|uniref:glycosyltransferase n=1 Tax=Clostridium sp. TaxID=1506 RepID=UPI00284CEF38|nr:glycosyltransferase [Clostridium sp.]MDR3598467.1 glycosyltransferase [Clostridium sp.]
MDLSIIIPVYNSEKTISKCIDSILEQDLKEKEIILIDDGSRDNSLHILLEYERKYDCVKVIAQDNMGQGVARNNWIKIAKGNYITFIDSDDYISGTDSYSRFIKKCYENNLDILIFNYVIVKDNIKNDVVTLQENIVFSKEEVLNKFLLTDEVEGYSWNKIFNSKLFKEGGIRFIEGKKYEDIPLVIEAIMLSSKIEFDNSKVYNYVINYLSTTQNININTLNDEACSMELIIDKLKEMNSDKINSGLKVYIRNRLKIYSIYRFKNLIKGKIKLSEFLSINKKYIQLLRKVL